MNEIEKPAEIERKKDNTDLRPALDFVKRHLDVYESNLAKLLAGPNAVAPNLNFLISRNEMGFRSCSKLDGQPQVTPGNVQEILPHIPLTFQKLSMLQRVDYSANQIVPVPIFEEDGTWHNVDEVSVAEFPRPHDHPSRILIGRSDGTFIFPSALPITICDSYRARWFYQLHVFIHEFFHTIEIPRRRKGLRKKVILEKRFGGRLTLDTWWKTWEEQFIVERNVPFATRYAASYEHLLNEETLRADPDAFDRALAEQICESFVGYILGISPNDEDNTNFKSHSPTAWGLMHKLATCIVVEM